MVNAQRTALLVSLTGAIVASAATADIIGVDNRNGFDPDSYLATGADYTEFRALIQDLGHTIVPLTSFTASDLSGLDALITHMPYSGSQAFTTSEIDAIQDFVANGGGYLMHSDGGGSSNSYVSNINTLMDPYGVTFNTDASDPSGFIVSSFETHPVTDGVGQFGVDFQRYMTVIDAPAFDLTTLGANSNVLAAVDGAGGAGNVAIVTDTSCWKDPGAGSDYGLLDLDNALVLTNIIGYITGGGGQRLSLSVSGNCPGTSTFEIFGATPNASVALVYGFGDGPTTIPPSLPCAGTVLDVGNPNLDYRVIRADANGEAVFPTFIPANACGLVNVQALDLETCATSNVVNP